MPIMMLVAVGLLMPAPCSAQSTQPDVALRSFLFYTGYSRLDPPNAGTSVDVIVPALAVAMLAPLPVGRIIPVYARALIQIREGCDSCQSGVPGGAT